MLMVMTPTQKRRTDNTPTAMMLFSWVLALGQSSFWKPQLGSSLGLSLPDAHSIWVLLLMLYFCKTNELMLGYWARSYPCF